MSKEYTLPESVQNLQAKQIMEMQMFGDVIEKMKWDLFVQWTVSSTVADREELHGKLLGVLDVQSEFERLANLDILIEDQETES